MSVNPLKLLVLIILLIEITHANASSTAFENPVRDLQREFHETTCEFSLAPAEHENPISQELFYVSDINAQQFYARNFYLLKEVEKIDDENESVSIRALFHDELIQYQHLMPKSLRIFEILAEFTPWIEFVKTKQKRHKWPDSFLNKHEHTVRDNLYRSHYEIVRDPKNPRIIRSAIRWINQWYSLQSERHFSMEPLPEAKFLGNNIDIILRANRSFSTRVKWGLNTEIGFWAIDEELPPSRRNILWRRQWNRFMKIAFDPSKPEVFNIFYHRYYTYADKYSLEVYGKPMGFRNAGDKIVKEGVEWQPLELNLDDIERFQLKLENGRQSGRDKSAAIADRRKAGMQVPTHLNLVREATVLFARAERDGFTDEIKQRADRFISFLLSREELFQEVFDSQVELIDKHSWILNFIRNKDKLLSFIASYEAGVIEKPTKGAVDFLLYLHEKAPATDRNRYWGFTLSNKIELLASSILSETDLYSISLKVLHLSSSFRLKNFHEETGRIVDVDYLIPASRFDKRLNEIKSSYESIIAEKKRINDFWETHFFGQSVLSGLMALFKKALEDPSELERIEKLKAALSKIPNFNSDRIIDILFMLKETPPDPFEKN